MHPSVRDLLVPRDLLALRDLLLVVVDCLEGSEFLAAETIAC